jgi:hypothetical protein
VTSDKWVFNKQKNKYVKQNRSTELEIVFFYDSKIVPTQTALRAEEKQAIETQHET